MVSSQRLRGRARFLRRGRRNSRCSTLVTRQTGEPYHVTQGGGARRPHHMHIQAGSKGTHARIFSLPPDPGPTRPPPRPGNDNDTTKHALIVASRVSRARDLDGLTGPGAALARRAAIHRSVSHHTCGEGAGQAHTSVQEGGGGIMLATANISCAQPPLPRVTERGPVAGATAFSARDRLQRRAREHVESLQVAG